MTETFLPFAKPSLNQAALDEIMACLKSGWLTTGPRVKQFEEALSHYLSTKQVLALSTATAGLHLALLGIGLKAGDEVITTPLTFVATLNTIAINAAKPVLVDINPKTYNMDVDNIEAAITPRTRAIVPVHFAGVPVDLDPLYALAEKHGLRVIEDAAHAIGTEYKGRRIGSFGDTQVFSFHANKVMTSGEGGCVSTRDETLAKHITVQRFHGIDREAWNRFSKNGSQHYDVIAPGFKYNMMDLQAALGIHQLEALENIIEKRAMLAQRYYEKLNNWPELTLPTAPTFSHRSSWYIFAPLINENAAGIDRDGFIQGMKEHNIGIGLHYTAAHLYTYYQKQFGYRLGDFPKAESVGSRIVSLPLFPDMTLEDQDRVITKIAAVFRRT
jgi:dTDP-4-amino-4,6-dideoxygalactose transaminase